MFGPQIKLLWAAIAISLLLTSMNAHADWEVMDSNTLADGAAATAISADGKTVVGLWSASNKENRVFKYAHGVMTDLGTLGGKQATVTALSADGSVVLGVSETKDGTFHAFKHCLLYTSPSPRDRQKSRMPSSA